MTERESDLYLPLKAFLESQEYEVKGEVLNCDVMAVRAEEEPVIVELKSSLNLTVILQSVERLSLTSKVYIGIPRKSTALKKKRKHILKLLKMLGLGLIVIDPGRKSLNVKILLDPEEYTPRKSKRRIGRLLGEFSRRIGDPNLGGQEAKTGTMTVYRQRALAIAHFLEKNGPTKASNIAQALQDQDVRNILYKNFYGWFERVSRGVYSISPRGKDEFPSWRGK